MTGQDSNRGACAQPCHYQYALMEEKRPGEYFPVFEDERGTYILNSQDMCMIDHLPDLMEAGVDCIKLEGRPSLPTMPPSSQAPTGMALMPPQKNALGPGMEDEVEHVSHRIYSTGFYYGFPGQYTESSRYIRQWQICALVLDCGSDGMATMSLRNKFAAGGHGGAGGAGYPSLFLPGPGHAGRRRHRT